MGYIIVRFSETRQVIIDDVGSGQNTGVVIEVEDGRHIIKLDGETNFRPPSLDLVVEETSELDPLEVVFNQTDAKDEKWRSKIIYYSQVQ